MQPSHVDHDDSQSEIIDLADPWDVLWWCVHLRCTESQLRAAVDAVGFAAEAVRLQLGK